MKTHTETVNTRILMLKTKLELGQTEFCNKTGMSSATYHNIKNDGEVRKSTARNIALSLNANPNWILTGEGEMFLEQTEQSSNPWKDALVSQVKSENERLQKEVERLWGMIDKFSGGKINFLKLLKTTGANGNKAKAFLRSQAA